MAFLLILNIYINWKEHKSLSLLKIPSPGQIEADPGEAPPTPTRLPEFSDSRAQQPQGLACNKTLLFLNKVFLCAHKWKCTQTLPEFILSGPLDKERLTKGE